jgi:hypothetical protein
MKKLLKTNYDRSTEYNKIQHSKVRIEQETVSNVRPKKTTSFEQKKDRRWADELGRETSQHLTWCISAVRQKVVFIRTMVNLWKSSKEGNPKKFRRPFEREEQIWAANETEVFFERSLSLEDRDRSDPGTFQRKETTVGDRRSNWNEWNETKSDQLKNGFQRVYNIKNNLERTREIIRKQKGETN